MEKMKRILFVYPEMMMGGSTTSLLSILYSLDFTKYEVELLLFRNSGAWLKDIPEKVKILKPCYKYPNNKQRILHQLFSPKFMKEKVVAKIIEKKYKSAKLGQQYLEMKDVDFFMESEGTYDIAVAFLEGQSCKYVANHVKAHKKIGWIHIDYKASGFNPAYDLECMEKMDKIVTVSQECRKSFIECFPTLSEKTVMIENILSSVRLQIMSEKENITLELDHSKLNLVTSCRISFVSKGLDRAVSVIARMKKNRINGFEKLRWYVIGDGNDLQDLKKMIKETELEETIIILGSKVNPYPYLKKMDLFFLPSYWEGKPMAVTEGQILGLPALVTEYASAKEQVKTGINGMIVENSEDGIYGGLEYVLTHLDKVKEWRLNVTAQDYSNQEDIKKVEELFDN